MILFRCLSRFKRINEDYLECNQKAQFASQAATQWLALRLQMIGVIIVTGVGVIAVLQHQFDVVDPALVGLTVSYALSITALLNGVVSAFAETEKELISLERVGQYIDEIEPEVCKIFKFCFIHCCILNKFLIFRWKLEIILLMLGQAKVLSYSKAFI